MINTGIYYNCISLAQIVDRHKKPLAQQSNIKMLLAPHEEATLLLFCYNTNGFLGIHLISFIHRSRCHKVLLRILNLGECVALLLIRIRTKVDAIRFLVESLLASTPCIVLERI